MYGDCVEISVVADVSIPDFAIEQNLLFLNSGEPYNVQWGVYAYVTLVHVHYGAHCADAAVNHHYTVTDVELSCLLHAVSVTQQRSRTTPCTGPCSR